MAAARMPMDAIRTAKLVITTAMGGGGQRAPAPKPTPFFGGGQGAYANCAAARAAGAAPVYRGDPGYGSHLDRDNDGVGCE